MSLREQAFTDHVSRQRGWLGASKCQLCPQGPVVAAGGAEPPALNVIWLCTASPDQQPHSSSETRTTEQSGGLQTALRLCREGVWGPEKDTGVHHPGEGETQEEQDKNLKTREEGQSCFGRLHCGVEKARTLESDPNPNLGV